jgi:hypothetical protein
MIETQWIKARRIKKQRIKNRRTKTWEALRGPNFGGPTEKKQEEVPIPQKSSFSFPLPQKYLSLMENPPKLPKKTDR